ncbi:MAG: zf-HC2 domain-containing protein [SAR324 cluster bacterium]|nr:zf-HC2 domain-containing protein [SAR324 cluster bacterium]
MITCEEASSLLSDRFDVPLSPMKLLLLRSHLMMCRKCAAIAQQLQSLRKIFLGLETASSHDEISMPVETKKRIQQALREQ